MRPRSPLRASLSRRRRALARHLSAALAGDSVAVHQARVASRRLREALPVVGADLDPHDVAKMNRRMRRLTRALGPVRELEVALAMSESAGTAGGGVEAASSAANAGDGGEGRTSAGHAAAAGQSAINGRAVNGTVAHNGTSLRALAQKGATLKDGVQKDGVQKDAAQKDTAQRNTAQRDTDVGREQLQRSLQHDLDRARANLTHSFDEHRIARWIVQLRALEETLGELHAPAEWRSELAGRLERRTDRLQTALDEAGVLFVADRLHEVRIALKKLRYALELAGELRLASTAAAVNGLKAVQDILGALHDLDVLMTHVSTAVEQPGLDRVTRASLLALHGALDVDRHKLHAQFLAQRPALLRLHDRALEVAARARTRRAPRAGARVSA